jgi:hypothetical protein
MDQQLLEMRDRVSTVSAAIHLFVLLEVSSSDRVFFFRPEYSLTGDAQHGRRP